MNIVRFQKLKFKIYDISPEDDVLEKFPELSKYKVIYKNKSPQKNLLIRYIIFLYDPNTDLTREIPDLKSRKIHAADLAGFKEETDYLKGIFNCTDEGFLTLLDCFFKEIWHNREYREWQTLAQELDEYTRLRWEQIDGKTGKKKGEKDQESEIDTYKAASEKTKLREQCDSIHKLMDAYELRIFGNHEDIKNIAVKTRYLSPENFAGITKYAV